MYLKSISLVNFKNFEQAELEFCPKINCFIGDNGVGKTNLLDAVHYLSLTKSYFNPVDSQNILHDKEFFVVQGTYSKQDADEKVSCGVKKHHGKTFKRNNKEYQKFSDHIGLFPVVMISPADINLILEGSEERRKFINSVISQYNKSYLENSIQYIKILGHRNKMLKDTAYQGALDHDLLQVIDEQLVQFGIKIFKERSEFSKQFIPVFQKFYNFISDQKERVDLKYISDLNDADFSELLLQNLNKDRAFQYTTTGVHKDDLLFNLGGHGIKRIGSQGQQKTYLVALKLANFEFISSLNEYKPIILLDDIFDKFDTNRVKKIIQLVADDNFGQIFITDTNRGHIQPILDESGIEFRIFNVDKGNVELAN